MYKKIRSALISVFYKDGLEPLVNLLHQHGVTIYSTGGTQQFIEKLGLECVPVESVTDYPSILGGRVKTLHPKIFGGILGRRAVEQDILEMKEYQIPEIDLVIVDLYPFEETVAQTSEEKLIIEKIDIGGPSMIRAAAKNFSDLLVIASKQDYKDIVELLEKQECSTNIEQRRSYAAKAFDVVAHYDAAISNYFATDPAQEFVYAQGNPQVLRYGENPHQRGVFYGNLDEIFSKIHGKELSYNNLVDVEAATQLIDEFEEETEAIFAIIKHTNVCGIASRSSVAEAWKYALQGDPESAFGGVLVCNKQIDKATADQINEIFFEVLIAPGFDEDALQILAAKKNRILLIQKKKTTNKNQFKSLLNGVLLQQVDEGNFDKWEEVGGRNCSEAEKKELIFANKVCKHLKSNAITLTKDLQLIGKGCGQTSRIDSLRHAIEKAKQFNFDLNGAVMASDAFFPFDDCVRMGHAEGVSAYIQPGGSIRDKDSIEYCKNNGLAMVMTGLRHFRH
ncbi:MAG: bifunctional phosphoribosylaminoimidazolecarboxamide formyltransferase/IMP cyclohydrolase [Chitinophagaceae bacterium]|nr:bifunctional phosphoribosylaminoimidazolecarboxamide formyltransferase/IMP cyclohydrolase [Chitinophagaceae bacterium]